MAGSVVLLSKYGRSEQAIFDESGNLDMSTMPSGSFLSIGGVRFYSFTTAITENSTTTSAPAGSYGFTSHATGKTKIFYSDGTNWQLLLADAAAGAVATADIANDAVTYAKIQNVSATDKVLGRSTAGAGDVEEIPCTASGRAMIAAASAPAQLALMTTALKADLDKLAASGAHIPSGTQQSSIADAVTDASEAHALNAVFDDTEVEAALNLLAVKYNALAVKFNAVLDALDAYGITL